MHTYTSINIHVVFATWSRQRLLDACTRPRLHGYVAATARNLGVAAVTVGGVEDHLHMLARFGPTQSISSVVGQLKKSSGDWLRQSAPHLRDFRWQRGFAAFSVSENRVAAVRTYVERQEEHHKRRSFHEELEALLRELNIPIDDVGLL